MAGSSAAEVSPDMCFERQRGKGINSFFFLFFFLYILQNDYHRGLVNMCYHTLLLKILFL